MLLSRKDTSISAQQFTTEMAVETKADLFTLANVFNVVGTGLFFKRSLNDKYL